MPDNPVRRLRAICDPAQANQQMDRNLVTGLLAWIIELRKFCNEDADVLPHLRQIDLCARSSNFMH